MNSAQRDALFSLTLAIDHQLRALRLRVPLWRETFTAILAPELRTPARLAAQLGVRIYDLVETDESGSRPRLASVKHWLSERQVAEALLDRHRLLLEVTSEAGAVQLGCPGCDGELELTLGALAIAVGSAMPPIFDGPFFALPPLASWPARPTRAGLRTCRYVAFRLPSQELGLPAPLTHGYLNACDTDPAKPREAALWRNWTAPPDVDPMSLHASRIPSCAGFRTAIRLCVALDDARNDAVTPDTIDAVPVCDVFFLNTLYWLVYAAAPSAPHTLTCPRCTTTFSPVR